MSALQPLTSAALEAVAAGAVERARRAGAEHAEAVVESGRAFTVRVSGGAIESLKQSVTHGLGLRVLKRGALGFVSTTDLRAEALDDLARHAVALARFSTPDEANALPTPAEAADDEPGDLGLTDPAVLALPAERKIEMALTLERAALGVDPRIRRTEGALVSTHDGQEALANSHGLLRSAGGTAVRVYVLPLADDRDGKQQTGWYGMVKRRLDEIADLEAIAREAARRALARIGARRVPTARVPVVMHPDIAGAWIAELHDAFSGESHIKQTTWLTGKLGESIASPLVTLVDDGRLPGGTGTAPWDGEGVPTRRNVLIERGRFATILYDTYHARRAGTRSTGSAVRSYSSTPGIGHHNLYVEAGGESPAAILERVERGFYMDDQGSYGFNAVTGDYSFQAQGFWIESGEKRFPVEGVTVAANSLEMLKNVTAVGSDLKFDGSVAAPTLLIAEMTVSGS
ncbi:MAG: TldD/PmbA family protein [Candidatus Eisenbacteria bacterium]|nr:TldD/PmbA family protein [Candidatus Eisenbacteria bacterium]